MDQVWGPPLEFKDPKPTNKGPAMHPDEYQNIIDTEEAIKELDEQLRARDPKPTKPGIYWYKYEDKWHIATIVRRASGLVIYVHYYLITVDDAEGRWGPEIIPPKD